jgi:hypothetical protein
VIGEQQDRVEYAASIFDAETYPGQPAEDARQLQGEELRAAQLKHNEDWINRMKEEGRLVIDTGPAEQRVDYPLPTRPSDWPLAPYEVELSAIDNYPNVIRPWEDMTGAPNFPWKYDSSTYRDGYYKLEQPAASRAASDSQTEAGPEVAEPAGSKPSDTHAEQHQDPTPASPDGLDAVTESPSVRNFREDIARGRKFEALERDSFKDGWGHVGDPGDEVRTLKGKYDRKTGKEVPTGEGRIDNRVHDQENDIAIINEVKATDWSQYKYTPPKPKEEKVEKEEKEEKAPWMNRADKIAGQVNSYVYGELSDPEGAESVQPYVTFPNRPRDPKNTDSVNEEFTKDIVDRFGEQGIYVEWAEDRRR